MEHMYFESQLCINISNFKDMSNIDILINLCLGASLQYVFSLDMPMFCLDAEPQKMV